MQAYQLKTDSNPGSKPKVGTVVYLFAGYDYGLARDDTKITGVEHIGVSLKRGGRAPSFTHPLPDLEPIEAEPFPKLTEEHVKSTCRPGADAATCRYLTMSASGWGCEKHTFLADLLDERVRKNTVIAQGDNCEGRE